MYGLIPPYPSFSKTSHCTPSRKRWYEVSEVTALGLHAVPEGSLTNGNQGPLVSNVIVYYASVVVSDELTTVIVSPPDATPTLDLRLVCFRQFNLLNFPLQRTTQQRIYINWGRRRQSAVRCEYNAARTINNVTTTTGPTK